MNCFHSVFRCVLVFFHEKADDIRFNQIYELLLGIMGVYESGLLILRPFIYYVIPCTM